MNPVHKFISITKDVAAYVNQLLDRGETVKMKELRQETEAIEHGEMQAPLSQLRVIISMMQMIGARRVLEVGTFRGMTAARLAAAFPKDVIGAKVVTIERDHRYVDELKKRWADLNVSDKIDLRSGQALDVLDQLADEVHADGYFDLAFIDADKENYKLCVEKTLRLMHSKGVVLIDNTLWRGEVALGANTAATVSEGEDKGADADASENKNASVGNNGSSNITRYIKGFNEWVFEKFGTNASIIPAWDGLTIIVKE